MEKDLILNGIRVGEYSFTPEEVYEKIEKECLPYGMNYVKISTRGIDYGKEFYVNLAKYLADHKIYFDCSAVFSYENPLGFDEETALAMKEVAGEYYHAHSIPELGTKFTCAARGYGSFSGAESLADDLLESQKNFDNYVNATAEKASLGGKFKVYNNDATMRLSCAIHQNLDIPAMELVPGNPEMMIPLLRATAKAMNSDFWMTYIAHEWYAGTKTLDPLKIKRLKMYYDYAYMSGSSCFVLESGDECLHAHDTAPNANPDYTPELAGKLFGYDHPVSQHYRQTLRDFAKFVREDARPKGGPKVKVAFVQGYLDGYSPWRAGSSLWNRFDNPDFSYSDPEFVWRIFDDLRAKRGWCDVHNFGEVDLSGAPAYGIYDIVPAWAGYETLSRYDYLIFTGWHTMTEEIYEDLKKYVANGGKLFMTAAHLNTSTKRTGQIKLIHGGKVSDLFGCDLDAEAGFVCNDGVKFTESIVPEFRYPASQYYDPLLSEGNIRYPKVSLTTGVPTGRLSHAFVDKDEMPPCVVENKQGKGYAVLMTTLDYPSGAAYPVYRTLVREILTASHRLADIKIYGGDRLRFTVYEGNKVYLLNTDFDCPCPAVIDYGTHKKTFLLEPMELRPVCADNA